MNKQVLAVAIAAVALFTIAIVGAFAFIGHDSGDSSPIGHTMSNGQTMTGQMHTMSDGSSMTGPGMGGSRTDTTGGNGMVGSGDQNGMMGGGG